MFLNFMVVTFFLFSTTKVYSSNECKFDVKMTQIILNEGFHRNITYGIIFNSENEHERWLPLDCIVGIEQDLPAGVFANPDELGDLRRMHKINAVPKNKVNVELAAEQSTTTSVYIIGKVADSKVYLWLPVHARYHQAVSGGGTARNEIPEPRLYLRCPDSRLEACCKAVPSNVRFLCNGSAKDKCDWKEIPFTLMSDTPLWDVPVGNTDDYYIVAGGTSLVVIIGSLYILRAVHDYNVALTAKKKKPDSNKRVLVSYIVREN